MKLPLPPQVLDQIRRLELAGYSVTAQQSPQRCIAPNHYETELTFSADGRPFAALQVRFQGQDPKPSSLWSKIKLGFRVK